MAEALLTPEQVSEQLQVSLRTLEDWRYHKIGPTFYRVGRHVRYRQVDIDRFVSQNKVTA